MDRKRDDFRQNDENKNISDKEILAIELSKLEGVIIEPEEEKILEQIAGHMLDRFFQDIEKGGIQK